jgi:uncharacterized protein (DUF2384 family)
MTNAKNNSGLTNLVKQAEVVFNNKKKAERWLNKPKIKLAGLTPIQAFQQDDVSKDQVELMLKKIQNGYV